MTQTLVRLWTAVRKRLEAAGVETPVIDARLLLEAGAAVSRLDIVTDPRRQLTDEQVGAVLKLVERRERREPVSHILGRKQFWTLDLHVSPSVLTPRPETEHLVDLAIGLLPVDAPSHVLDLGTGSGAILLAVLAERVRARGIGVDISADALAIAQGNAIAADMADRTEFRQGGWNALAESGFDLVVANPPYIATAEIDALQPEVARYEPRIALDGGHDGLEAYRAIVPELPRLLRPSGAFALEVGKGQAEAVMALAASAGLLTELPRRDLAGIPRVVWGRSPARSRRD